MQKPMLSYLGIGLMGMRAMLTSNTVHEIVKSCTSR